MCCCFYIVTTSADRIISKVTEFFLFLLFFFFLMNIFFTFYIHIIHSYPSSIHIHTFTFYGHGSHSEFIGCALVLHLFGPDAAMVNLEIFE